MTDLRTAYMIVDGEYLFTAPQTVVGRPPTKVERLDYGSLFRYAQRDLLGPRVVRAIYFQRKHDGAEPFYAALRGFGYQVDTTPMLDDTIAVEERILQALLQLQREDGDIIYVGGANYAGEVQSRLDALLRDEHGVSRTVAIIHFGGLCEFNNPAFLVQDLVLDVKAMPRTIYGSEQSAEPKSRSPDLFQPTHIKHDRVPLHGLDMPGSGPDQILGDMRRSRPGDVQLPDRDTLASNPTSDELILVDGESIERTISDLLQLDILPPSEFMPRWDALRAIIEPRVAGSEVRVVSFHLRDPRFVRYARPTIADLDILFDTEQRADGAIHKIEKHHDTVSAHRRRRSDEDVDRAIFDVAREFLKQGADRHITLVSASVRLIRMVTRYLDESNIHGNKAKILSLIAFLDKVPDEIFNEISRNDRIEMLDIADDLNLWSRPRRNRVRPINPATLDGREIIDALFNV